MNAPADQRHQELVRLLSDYTAMLQGGLDASDPRAIASALTTIGQAVDQALPEFDPDEMTAADVTHENGRYVGPRADEIALRAWTRPTIERVVMDLELVLHQAGGVTARGDVIQAVGYGIYEYFKTWGSGQGTFDERTESGEILSATIRYRDAAFRAERAETDESA